MFAFFAIVCSYHAGQDVCPMSYVSWVVSRRLVQYAKQLHTTESRPKLPGVGGGRRLELVSVKSKQHVQSRPSYELLLL